MNRDGVPDLNGCGTKSGLQRTYPDIGPNLFHQNRTVSWLISMPRSCISSSKLRSESGKRTYSITARRMISGLVLRYLNGARFVIRRGYETARPVSSSFCLTVPLLMVTVERIFELQQWSYCDNIGQLREWQD